MNTVSWHAETTKIFAACGNNEKKRENSFYPFFLWVLARKSRWSRVGTLTGRNFEDYIRFVSHHLFGPVKHGQNWKGWERSGEKGLIIKLVIVSNDLIIKYE